MKRLGWLPCVLSLAVGAAACNGNADYGDQNGTARTDTGIDGSVGTAGDGTTSSPNRVQDDNRTGGQQARAELPDTASWLPSAGIFGLLSMGAAFGMRYLRRR